MRNASLVTVCNSYLKQKAIDSNAKKIEIIPTVVDLERYNDMCEINNTKLTIGWIGTPKTEKYIIELKSVFETISKEIDLKIVVIGGKEFSSDIFEYEIVPWSEDKEVEYINKLDIGIMPLSDSKWEKGKCGYKLIQYMACGKPVIASAIGMNCDIVENNKNGFLVNNNTEWINAIKNLKDSKIRKEMGYYGKNLVEKNYSLQATINKKISHILGNI
jgi:glycosyltransferase involved in cell wall biosynthesis